MSAHRLSFRTVSIVGITLLALALGGSTELWAQAIVLLLAALLILVYPPRLALGTTPTWVLVLLMAVALAAFLPVAWGIAPEWRRHLSDDLHASLGNLRTPQPWLTLQACGLLYFGIVWTYYLFALDWSPSEKSQALRLVMIGVVLLAAISIISFEAGYRIPGWNHEQNRGWFPNRNQTANVLALSGIVTYAIAFKRLQRRERTGYFWMIGLGVICAALVISYSRAGILIFFAGVSLWQLGSLFRPNEGKHVAVGLAAVVFMLSLFLLFGGTTLERFLNVPEPVNPYEDDYRILIQEDALQVSLQTPLLGVGLGNFEPVFTSMRDASADQNRTLHPESDWLWMAVEMGWLAPLLVVVGVRWWVGQCLPFALKSGESVRRAAMVAAILFLIHGFVDVSGHRLGSVLLGLFVACVALGSKPRWVARPWIAPIFRGLGAILFLIGAWWLVSFGADLGPPTTATLARLQTGIDQDADDGRLASMSEAANAAIEISPLNWTYYFRRASAEAFRTGATEAAANDFAIARFLEPHWIGLCVNEGDVWLGAGQPDKCLDAWREALRRAGGNSLPTYAMMLKLARSYPEIHQGLKALAGSDLDDRIAFLDDASPDEAKAVTDDLLAHDADLHSLSFGQQRELFAAWYARGNRDDLTSLLLAQPDLQIAGWKYLAEQYADQRDFETASVTAMRYLPSPVIPPLPGRPPTALDGATYDASHDLASGILLCQAQMRENRVDDALATIAVLEQNKNCPRYVYYLEAQLDVKKQLWEEAWNALRQVDPD